VEKSLGIAVGVDIIEIDRIEEAALSWQGSFLKRIYTEAELESSGNKPSSLAARFAAKEAVMKALGTGAKGLGWKDIEVLSNSDGAPFVRLHGRAYDKAKEIGMSQFAISMSHSRRYAIAMVVGYAT
jgi:holo-[acyl-carrier protein] synthase